MTKRKPNKLLYNKEKQKNIIKKFNSLQDVLNMKTSDKKKLKKASRS